MKLCVHKPERNLMYRLHSPTLMRKGLCDDQLAVRFFLVRKGKRDASFAALPVLHGSEPKSDSFLVHDKTFVHIFLTIKNRRKIFLFFSLNKLNSTAFLVKVPLNKITTVYSRWDLYIFRSLKAPLDPSFKCMDTLEKIFHISTLNFYVFY